MNVTPYANSLFEQPWWLNIVAPGQWKETFAKDEDGSIIGRLAYAADNKHIYMPKLTQTLGIWMSPDVKKDYGMQKKVINELFEPLSFYNSAELYLSPENQYVLPFRWLGYSIEPQFTYRLADLSDCEKIYQSLGKTVKKNIKYANNKVEIYEKADVDTLWTLLNHTFEAQKRKNPMPKDLVYKIVESCEENGHGKYMGAKDSEGHVHSCAYFVYDKAVCYYLFGALDSKYRSSGAQSLILWKAIQFAAQHSAVFDFEGSMVEGIENFFRQFGGKQVIYYRVKKQSLYKDLFDVAKPRIKRLLGYKI